MKTRRLRVTIFSTGSKTSNLVSQCWRRGQWSFRNVMMARLMDSSQNSGPTWIDVLQRHRMVRRLLSACFRSCLRMARSRQLSYVKESIPSLKISSQVKIRCGNLFSVISMIYPVSREWGMANGMLTRVLSDFRYFESILCSFLHRRVWSSSRTFLPAC